MRFNVTWQPIIPQGLPRDVLEFRSRKYSPRGRHKRRQDRSVAAIYGVDSERISGSQGIDMYWLGMISMDSFVGHGFLNRNFLCFGF